MRGAQPLTTDPPSETKVLTEIGARLDKPIVKPDDGWNLPASGRTIANNADRRTVQRLKRGMMPIDGRLDLHGLTQKEAHERLASFIAIKQRQGARCVLVITGRGIRYGGILKHMTPRWLDEPPNRERVLTYSDAQIKHGGDGALYVLLRRRR